jgi:hypothetical protein
LKQLIIIILISITLLLNGCDKKKTNVYPGNAFGDETFKFKPCVRLTQPNTGWADSTSNSIKNPYSAVINPANPNEIIYVANGKIINYNRSTRTKQTICSSVFSYKIEINKSGDILFANPQQKICTVKSNGDSLKVFNHTSYLSYWDYTGNFIYYYANNILYKVNANNGSTTNTYSNLPQPFGYLKYSDKLICSNTTLKKLYLKDISTGVETLLLSNINTTYNLITSDKNDNIYWYNNDGIVKLNYSTKTVDTLVKACQYAYVNNVLVEPNTYVLGLNVSPNTDVMTFVYQEWIPITPPKKYTVSNVIQIDLNTKIATEIKGLVD